MAGGNTIGTGAVVLTANADALLAGLDKAGKATEKWAANAGKGVTKAVDGASGGKGGGLLGKLFGGVGGGLAVGGGALVAGGPAGIALAGIGAGITAVTKGFELAGELATQFLDRLTQVGERAKLYSNIDPIKAEGIERTTGAFDRITAAVDDFFFSAAESLAPTLEKVASVIEVVGFVGAEVFNELVDGALELADQVGAWLGLWEENGMATADFGKLAMEVLRNIGIGAAYAWDTIKAGAGAVAYVAGVIVDGFGQVVQVIASAAKQLDNLAKELPEAIRPDWIGKAANAMDGFGAKTEAIGAGMQKWGKGAIAGFGDSAGKVEKWFDRIEGKFAATERLQKVVEDKWKGPMLSGAFTANSTEAYSVMAKFSAGNTIADSQKRMENLNRQQLDELKEINKKTQPLGRV